MKLTYDDVLSSSAKILLLHWNLRHYIEVAALLGDNFECEALMPDGFGLQVAPVADPSAPDKAGTGGAGPVARGGPGVPVADPSSPEGAGVGGTYGTGAGFVMKTVASW